MAEEANDLIFIFENPYFLSPRDYCWVYSHDINVKCINSIDISTDELQSLYWDYLQSIWISKIIFIYNIYRLHLWG
jgi:hypothetical protein